MPLPSTEILAHIQEGLILRVVAQMKPFLFAYATMNYIDIRQHAKRTIDLSHIAWECGYLKNNCGNFSLVRIGENYLATFRLFGFWITKER